MSNKYMADAAAFDLKFNLTPVRLVNDPILLPSDLHDFRCNFLNEELTEFNLGLGSNDIAECADALIDLMYIICGTALKHQLAPTEWPENGAFNVLAYKSIPSLASKTQSLQLEASLMKGLIDGYYVNHAQLAMQLTLLNIAYHQVINMARRVGISQYLWDELWDDVQAANMRKVKATSDDQSKRGSAKFDIVKPPGWVPPRTKEIIQRVIAR